jgi:hypothetical protein
VDFGPALIDPFMALSDLIVGIFSFSLSVLSVSVSLLNFSLDGLLSSGFSSESFVLRLLLSLSLELCFEFFDNSMESLNF